MHNTYFAEATALLTEAAQELPAETSAAAAIKATMAQAYATLALAQEVAKATDVLTATPGSL